MSTRLNGPTTLRPPMRSATLLLALGLVAAAALWAASRFDQARLRRATADVIRQDILVQLGETSSAALRLALALGDLELAGEAADALVDHDPRLSGLRVELPDGNALDVGVSQPDVSQTLRVAVRPVPGDLGTAFLRARSREVDPLGWVEVHLDPTSSTGRLPSPPLLTPWLLVLTPLLGLVFFYRFRRRLVHLCDAAAAISRGSFDEVPVLRGHDEFTWAMSALSNVADVLAEQVDRVQGRNADLLRDATLAEDRLSRLDAFASTLVSPIREQGLADQALASIVSHTNASAAMLFLGVAGSEDQIRCVSVSGFSLAPDDPRIESGRQALGLTPANLGPVVTRRPPLGLDHPWMAGRSIPLSEVLWVPLLFRDGLEGAIVLASKTPWGTTDLEFVADAARPLAISLANLRAFDASVALARALEERNDELVRQGERLKVVDRLRSQFVANMSHELRTPLNAIIGYTELIADECFGPVTPEQSEHLESVLTSSHHLLQLVNQVLDLSRAETGGLALDCRECDLLQIGRESARLLAPLCRDRPYQLKVVGRSLRLVTDGERVHQILTNLLNNAIKFTEKGSVTLHVLPSVGGGGRLVVEDTGIGIDEAHIELVFEQFQQVDGSSTRAHDGVGLGLAISRKLAQAMGGSLSVRSQVGRGSTFTLSLPARPPADVDSPNPSAYTQAS